MIRRTLQPDGLVLVESELRVELHDAAGTIVEGRAPTASELAQLRAWASGRRPGVSERLTKAKWSA